MKLIIEIPIDLLERTKSGDYDFGDDLARNEVIVNGTPYNPTGDLISRSALKTELEVYRHTRNYKSDEDEAQNALLDNILEDIDNAPPVPQVTVFTENADEKAVADMKAELQSVIGARPNEQIAWEQGFEAGLAQGKNDRPQGEWIYGEDDCGQDGWFCSECNFFVPWYYQYYEKDIDFIREYKACPHCLAEMVTYTGKNRNTRGGDPDEPTS